MPKRKISLEQAELELWQQSQGESSKSIDPRLVQRVIKECLSEKQQEYLRNYYFDGMSMRQSAEIHGVCISTVSRTISRAERRIRAALKYVVRR